MWRWQPDVVVDEVLPGSYAGQYVNFERIWSWPKPAQKPHPPVIVGGNGPTVTDRVRAFGDAWMPNYAREGFLERAAELRESADRSISLQVMGITADARVIASLEQAGFDRVVHWVPSAGQGRIEAEMDLFEAAIAEAHGE